MSQDDWRRRLRARVSFRDLTAARARLVPLSHQHILSLRPEKAQAGVLEAIAEAQAGGASEAEVDAELAAYRTELFDVDAFVVTSLAITVERGEGHPELGGQGWATLLEVPSRAGVDEGLARTRYQEALRRNLVREVEPAGPTAGPAFAPTSRTPRTL